MPQELLTGGSTARAIKGPVEFDQIIARAALADQTGDTAAQDMTISCTWFRALIYIKTYVVGTATIGPFFTLEVDTATGMATALESVAHDYADNIASTTKVQTLLLIGRVGITQKRYARINVTLSGTATISYDVHIDAA